MNFFPNEAGYQPRVMLIGGTSEIGLAILAALGLPPNAEIILAGRDEQRLAAAGKELPGQVRTVHYDALETAQATRRSSTACSPTGTWTWSSPRPACWSRRPTSSATSSGPPR